MNKVSFLPVFEVGLANEEMPACRQINTATLDPAIVAGMCASIIDFTISKIKDDKQIDFENETINLLNLIIENRHDYTNRVQDFEIEN